MISSLLLSSTAQAPPKTASIKPVEAIREENINKSKSESFVFS